MVKASQDVGRVEIREVFENLRLGHTGRREVEHILHADAHPTDAGTSPAWFGMECDAVVHGGKSTDALCRVTRFCEK
jgi:hypothetical protein